jgi:alpha-glucosidase
MKAAAGPGYWSIGRVEREEQDEGGAWVWRFAAADGTRAEVAILAEDLARVRLLPPGVLPAPSWAVVREEWPAVTVHETSGESGMLRLTTGAMRLEIGLDPMRLTWSWPDGAPFAEDDAELGMGYVPPLAPDEAPDVALPPGSVRCYKRLAPGERILGAGERTHPLDRRGERLVYWNIDPPQPHGADTRAMYASIPFWIGLRGGRAYGIFLDSVGRSDVDAGATRADQIGFGAAGGDLTYYVFAGPSPAAVLARYADLTGHMPLPPKWALGYGQCRWSYYPEEQVRQIAIEFRRRDIPCDALWLDIDYMDGYRDFTFNPRRFPDPDRLFADLAAQGFKVVTIVDSGVKVDPTDPTYVEGLERDAFVRRTDGSLFVGVVWPGESVFPDFTRADVREWWGERHQSLLDAGVAAIWDDMNEPSLTDRLVPDGGTPHGTTMPHDVVHHPDGFDGQAVPHAALHNAYGMQMARATHEGLARLRPERRPFVLTRSGYAGIQRYAAVWTGDNESTWEHLRLAARMCLALGLSGVPFCGFDTGGFWLSATGPLIVRFTQLGAVFPFFRNHSALATASQEPWVFGQPFEAFCRAAIELRYRLLPYLYTAFAEAARTGAPIARPLIYAYPGEESLANIDDEHLLGGDLLCAPVLEEDQPRRFVQFARGAWVDWQTGERIVGPLRRWVDSPLDVLPLFVREGAILPMGPVMQYVGERPEDPITLAVYLGPGEGARAEGALYEDDGATPAYQEGVWRLTRFSAEWKGETVTVSAEAPEGGYEGGAHEWVVELHLPYAGGVKGQRPAVRAARLGERDLADIEVAARRYETVARVAVGHASASFVVEVTLG